MTPNERSLADLIAAVLSGEEDDQSAWDAILELQRRGDAAVFEAATGLLRSSSAKERARGVDILAQLGTPKPSEDLRGRCADAILEILAKEQSPTVLHSIGVALGHLRDPRAVGALLPFLRHPDSDVRFGVVLGLSPHTVPPSVESLIELSGDADEEVRNWATFGLGTMEQLDSPALREALLRRITDENAEIRGEALAGLAQRKDLRVVDPLRRELTARPVGVLTLEAAASLGDPSLLPLLLQLRQSGTDADGYFSSVLDGAIRALTGAKPISE